MDNIDAKIINILRKNSRTGASEISEKVKLSVSAVIERIKKLEGSGVILGYTLILDNQKIGKDVTAFIYVSLERPQFNAQFEADVQSNQQITECHYITGDFDYLLKVVAENTKSLENVLNEIKSIQGVSKTLTNIVFSTTKNEVSAAVRSKKEKL
jgi:Transcriptional regulators